MFMVLVELDDSSSYSVRDLKRYDVVYLSGSMLIVNPLFLKGVDVNEDSLRLVKILIRHYGRVFYASYIVNRNHSLYGIRPEYVSMNLLYDENALFVNAKIIIASGVIRSRLVDDLLSQQISVLRPSVKALINLRNRITNVHVIDRLKPQYVIGIEVEKFGPLLNIEKTSFIDAAYMRFKPDLFYLESKGD